MACSALSTRFKRACLNRSTSIEVEGKSAPNWVRITIPLRRRVRLVEVAKLVDDRVQVGRLELQVLDASEPEEVLEDAMQPMDLVLEPLDPLEHATVARGLGVLKVLGKQVEIQRDRGERVADLMGETAGKLRDLGVLGAEPAGDFRFELGGRMRRHGASVPVQRRPTTLRRLGAAEVVGRRTVPPVLRSGASEIVLGTRFAMRELRRLPEVWSRGDCLIAAGRLRTSPMQVC